MSRARPLLWGLLLLCACAPQAKPPNVLLLVVDTLRADHLSTYGYGWETSPNIDALGARGAVFLDCMAQSSWTMPSMMSMLTSQPIFHTIWRLPASRPVMGEHFRAHGYRTGAFVANSVLHHDAGFARGFDAWDVREKGKRQWTAADVNRKGKAFLDEEDPRPWLLWLHYLDPHHPYEPPQVHLQRDNETVFSEATLATIDRVIAEADPSERAFLETQKDELYKDVDAYDGEITFTDEMIGELLDDLERRGMLEDTIIVLVSDHGETLYARPEHPEKIGDVEPVKRERGEPMLLSDYLQDEHGYWMYQELVHTPFIIAGPGVAPGQRIDALVSNLEVVPTVVELAGLPPMSGAAGRSLAAALGPGGTVTPSPLVVSSCYENHATRTPDGVKVICPPEKMQRDYGFRTEMYDLSADAEERSPLPLGPRAHQSCAYLREARDTDVFREFSANQEMDAETRQRLCEMGYIECN